MDHHPVPVPVSQSPRRLRMEGALDSFGSEARRDPAVSAGMWRAALGAQVNSMSKYV